MYWVKIFGLPKKSIFYRICLKFTLATWRRPWYPFANIIKEEIPKWLVFRFVT